jgi:feruloyl-CoA synthase
METRVTHPFFYDDPTKLAPARVVKEDLGDGIFVLRSPEALQPYDRCVGEWLERWAQRTPDALAFAERDADDAWRRLTWGEARTQVGALAQGLLDLQLPEGAPVVILSDNSVDHLLLMLAALHIGRPVCTVSSAYCRLAKVYDKVHGILAALRPGLLYAGDAKTYAPAMTSAGLGVPLVFSEGAETVRGALSFAELGARQETGAVLTAFEKVAPDDVAKYLLTSGSTGVPKVVVNTHRMLCANQQMIAQAWRFLDQEKPVLLDWLPWSHTFGGNHNLNLVLRNGGTLYIDEGRPAPGLIDKTVRNLREVRPNLYFNVPRGFEMLVPALEADEALARDFFAPLRMAFYAAAALPQACWERLEALARKVRDEPVWFTTSWGCTETAPAVTSAHFKLDRAGCLGLPLPGVELKFVPNGPKLELRVKGVSVFPHYRDAPELTAQAFDADGFYRIGDAGHLLDPHDAQKGIAFNGRVSEDFKLTTGTWVSVGTLRLKLVSALAPLALDAVITGHDRDEVGALVFVNPAVAREWEPERVRDHVRQALRALRAEGGGSSQTPTRVLLLAEPPSAEAGEITDKGYVNQRRVLELRPAEVAALYGEADDARVVLARTPVAA